MAKKSKKGKGLKKGFWHYAFLVVFTLMLAFATVAKLFGFPMMRENMAIYGFPPVAMHILGLVWLIIVVGVWFDKYRLASLLGASWIIAGATAAHIAIDQAFPWFLLVHIGVIAIMLHREGFCDYVFKKKA